MPDISELDLRREIARANQHLTHHLEQIAAVLQANLTLLDAVADRVQVRNVAKAGEDQSRRAAIR